MVSSEGSRRLSRHADGDWKQRARRAEAEAAVARTEGVAVRLQADARLSELERSISWGITEPLRWFNKIRKQRGSAE